MDAPYTLEMQRGGNGRWPSLTVLELLSLVIRHGRWPICRGLLLSKRISQGISTEENGAVHARSAPQIADYTKLHMALCSLYTSGACGAGGLRRCRRFDCVAACFVGRKVRCIAATRHFHECTKALAVHASMHCYRSYCQAPMLACSYYANIIITVTIQ